MSWDWKKAIGVADLAAGTILSGSPGPKRSPAKGKEPASSPGSARLPSIAWRTGGAGYGLPGSSVELADECEHACPFCRGRGQSPSGSICPVCNGRKTVHVEAPSVRCAFCGGQGQMPPRSNMTCWVCNGKGRIAVTPPVQACPDCQGRGRKQGQSLYCRRCKGVGVVPWAAGL